MSRATTATIDVCPTSDELSVEDPTECIVPGCRKMFKSSACLQMHVRRRHEGKSLSVNNDEKRVYYCPVENCDRRKGKENPFPRLGQLKQVLSRWVFVGRLATYNDLRFRADTVALSERP